MSKWAVNFWMTRPCFFSFLGSSWSFCPISILFVSLTNVKRVFLWKRVPPFLWPRMANYNVIKPMSKTQVCLDTEYLMEPIKCITPAFKDLLSLCLETKLTFFLMRNNANHYSIEIDSSHLRRHFFFFFLHVTRKATWKPRELIHKLHFNWHSPLELVNRSKDSWVLIPTNNILCNGLMGEIKICNLPAMTCSPLLKYWYLFCSHL